MAAYKELGVLHLHPKRYTLAACFFLVIAAGWAATERTRLGEGPCRVECELLANQNKEPSDGRIVAESLSGRHESIMGVAIDQAQSILVTVGGRPSVLVWYSFDSPKKRRLFELKTRAPVFAVTIVNPEKGDALIAAGDSLGRIQFWDAATGKEAGSIDAYMSQVHALTYSRRDNVLVSSGPDRHIRFWNVQTKKEVKSLKLGLFHSMAFSPSGDLLALSSTLGQLHVLKYPSCETAWKYSDEKFGHAHGHSVDFAPNGKTIITPEREPLSGGVRFWDVETGLPQAKIVAYRMTEDEKVWADLNRQPYGIRVARYSPSGLIVASAGYDHKIGLWEAATRQHITTLAPSYPKLSNYGFSSLLFYENDDKFIATSFNGQVIFCDLAKIKRPLRVPKSRPLPANLDGWWDDLQSGDALKAVVAVEFFLEHAKVGVPFLKQMTIKKKQPSTEVYSNLIKDLGSTQFEIREKARVHLDKNLYTVEPLLKERLTKNPEPEVRRRIEGLLAKIPKLDGLRPADLRPLRVISILERIDSHESRELLTWMSRELDTGYLRSTAKRALPHGDK